MDKTQHDEDRIPFLEYFKKLDEVDAKKREQEEEHKNTNHGKKEANK